MNTSDLLEALRLWLPTRAARDRLQRELGPQLVVAVESLVERTSDDSLRDAQPLLKHLAIAVGRGYLKSATDWKGPPEQLDRLTDVLRRAEWTDLVFAAACLAKSEPANRELVAVVSRQVVPALARRFGRARAESIAEELPSRLHEISQTGLNRGRPRLQAYSGKASLVAWLRSVALNHAYDQCKIEARHASDDTDFAAHADPSSADPAAETSREERLRMLAPAVREAFPKLMNELRDKSPAQYKFAYLRCVKRLRYVEIAEQLRVGKPRVSQLSEAVCTKLVARVGDALPTIGIDAQRISPTNRSMLEEALQAMLSDSGATPAAVPDEGDVAAPGLTAAEEQR